MIHRGSSTLKRFVSASLFLPLLCIFNLNSGWANQVDYDAFIRLENGMSEKEVRSKAGKPDKEIRLDSSHRRKGGTKQLLYIPKPTEGDPYLTIITVQGGRVLEIERIKLLSAPKRAKGGQMDLETFNSLKEGMSEGEIIARAGAPDKETYGEKAFKEEGDEKDAKNKTGKKTKPRFGSVKNLLFIPGPKESDPYLTVVTLLRGKVIRLERTKVISK